MDLYTPTQRRGNVVDDDVSLDSWSWDSGRPPTGSAGRKEMFLFNETLNTFYLKLYGPFI